jgi:hypothetical protein
MVQSTSSITSISSMPLQQAAEAIDTDTSTNASSAFPQAIPRNLTRPRASPILPYRGPSTPQPRTRSQSRPPSYPHTPCGAPPPCPSVLLSFCPFVPLSLCPFLSLLAPPRPSRSQRERGLLPPVSDAPASRHWWKAIQTQPPQRGRRTLCHSSTPRQAPPRTKTTRNCRGPAALHSLCLSVSLSLCPFLYPLPA